MLFQIGKNLGFEGSHASTSCKLYTTAQNHRKLDCAERGVSQKCDRRIKKTRRMADISSRGVSQKCDRVFQEVPQLTHYCAKGVSQICDTPRRSQTSKTRGIAPCSCGQRGKSGMRDWRKDVNARGGRVLESTAGKSIEIMSTGSDATRHMLASGLSVSTLGLLIPSSRIFLNSAVRAICAFRAASEIFQSEERRVCEK
jgi:hypothetical protein